jgi:hypothetical protein
MMLPGGSGPAIGELRDSSGVGVWTCFQLPAVLTDVGESRIAIRGVGALAIAEKESLANDGPALLLVVRCMRLACVASHAPFRAKAGAR